MIQPVRNKTAVLNRWGVTFGRLAAVAQQQRETDEKGNRYPHDVFVRACARHRDDDYWVINVEGIDPEPMKLREDQVLDYDQVYAVMQQLLKNGFRDRMIEDLHTIVHKSTGSAFWAFDLIEALEEKRYEKRDRAVEDARRKESGPSS